MDKLIRDGMVAVLISPGYGAGWSTWNYHKPELLFDPTLVQMVLENTNSRTLVEYVNGKYPYAYTGGIETLKVVWVPKGTKFKVTEYDGHENLIFMGEEAWHVA